MNVGAAFNGRPGWEPAEGFPFTRGCLIFVIPAKAGIQIKMRFETPSQVTGIAAITTKKQTELFEEIISFENLLSAARKAQRGKRFQENIAVFNLNLEKEIFRLREEIRAGTYRPGSYRQFFVREKETRLISAAPYRDRVAHHAIMNVIEPILSRSFIFDSYANRVGKGTHHAVRRFREFLRSSRYVLKMDIRKYFHSIDHEILLGQIERKIKDSRVSALLRLIVETSPPQEKICDYFPGDGLLTPVERKKGLPIGNLTSQFFANYYLDGFDHFMKEILKCRRYLRYVDDFAVLGESKDKLWDIRDRAGKYLEENLRLKLHPVKTRVYRSDEGITFLGYRVWPERVRLERGNVIRFRRRLKRMRKEYSKGATDLAEVKQRLAGWLGHARQADTVMLRRQIFGSAIFRRDLSGSVIASAGESI